jgi:regulator of sirC expression with transglutaminase-like and TPR domain
MTPQAERFRKIVAGPDEHINLAEAALLIAAGEYPGIDVDAYLRGIDALAATLRQRLRADISAADKIILLNRYLFDELGFRGNSAHYYDPRNSYLNEVLDRKLGIPLTLAIVYIEIGRRVGLPLQGVAFPGHFLVKCALREGAVILDPFARGASLGFDDLKLRLRNLDHGAEPSRSVIAGMLANAGNREILVRMLRNLKSIYTQEKVWLKALAVSDQIICVTPDLAEEYRDRGMCYLNLECFRAALFDLQAYLKMLPGAQDADRVRSRVVELQSVAARLN